VTPNIREESRQTIAADRRAYWFAPAVEEEFGEAGHPRNMSSRCSEPSTSTITRVLIAGCASFVVQPAATLPTLLLMCVIWITGSASD